MLGDCAIIAFVATTDAGKARQFYRDVLGLRLAAETPFALEFEVGGTMLRVAKVERLAPAPYTVLGWGVPDIGKTVRDMMDLGVAFERFPGMDQDERGIWASPSGALVAWFRDPDGNVLSLTQFP